MSGYMPEGCTQAMHDRAFADETRERCQTCDGAGVIEIGDAGGGCIIEEKCDDCHGTGYEPIPDTREDDAYDQARNEDIEF